MTTKDIWKRARVFMNKEKPRFCPICRAPLADRSTVEINGYWVCAPCGVKADPAGAQSLPREKEIKFSSQTPS